MDLDSTNSYKVEFLVCFKDHTWTTCVIEVPANVISLPLGSPDGQADAVTYAYESNCGGNYKLETVERYVLNRYWTTWQKYDEYIGNKEFQIIIAG